MSREAYFTVSLHLIELTHSSNFSLNGNNVCLMLEIADAHNASVLMDACIPIVS